MKSRNFVLIKFVLLITVFNVTNSYGQDGDLSGLLDDFYRVTRENLGGLKKVGISVASSDKILKNNGLTKDQLKIEAEIRS